MEIREYAETILFSSALADKLCAPGKPTDLHPGKPVPDVKAPGRPDGLRLDDRRPRAPFPKMEEMADPIKRGEVLHFFANHELLALELMALTLLRFPTAPSVFRRTLVATMRDEQRHLRLYLKRMSEFGVSFGALPVNAFFWNRISGVTSPIDFTARVSLTFEQANLDFAQHFLGCFEALQDEPSTAIMKEVLRDEIVHVAHGVRFFNQWKDSRTSLWDAYLETLRHPMTPAWARGIGFCAEARRAAGLSEDFIERLRVASQNKGRPPHVHLFNPATEAALAHGNDGYTPPEAVRSMARDLETLPMFLAGAEDVVLVNNNAGATLLRAGEDMHDGGRHLVLLGAAVLAGYELGGSHADDGTTTEPSHLAGHAGNP